MCIGILTWIMLLCFSLLIGDIQNFKLIGYTDSDFAGSIDDRKNTSWYVFSFGSGSIAWESKKQSTLTISSAEAEYVAIIAAACQTVWMRRTLSELQHEQNDKHQFSVIIAQLFHSQKITSFTKELSILIHGISLFMNW